MTQTRQYTVSGPAKFPGRCVVCGSNARDFEATLLRDSAGKFAVAHDRCAGQRRKHKVGGASALIGPDTVSLP